jgi:choline monooxygenase
MQALFDTIADSTTGNGGLPNGIYNRHDFFLWERQNLFGSGWFGVAFAADVPNPGDVQKIDVLGLSLILLRTEAGEVKTFYNVCRHRGRQLVDEPCTGVKLLRCPYHAWTYRLDGQLQGTPHIGGTGVHRVDNFDKSQFGLYEIRNHVWMDIVFVNLSGAAESFATWIEPLEKRLERFWGSQGPGQMHPARDGVMEMQVESNWKLALENFLEAYHLPFVHPGLNSYSPLKDHYCIISQDNFAGQGVNNYQPNIGTGTAMPTISTWTEELGHTAEYPALYPNVLIGIQRDHFFTMLLIPLETNKTLERVELLFVGDSASDEAYINTRQAILEGWRVVFQEDVAAVEGLQAGRQIDVFDGGVLTPVLDRSTHHFHRWFARQATNIQV